MKVRDSGNKLIIFGIVAVIVLSIYAIRLAMANKKPDVSKMTDDEIAIYLNEKIDEMEKEKLSELGERDRMEHYVAEFISSIEKEDYESAYEMLYGDFKTNYFPTLENFKEYVSTKFPKFIAIEHTNIERNGDTYVLWTNFSDSLGSKDSSVEMKFVIKEYDLNDFKMSFSVIL